MIARKYETIVGIFVVASVVALIIMVIIIARQEGLFQAYVEYRTIFKNVSGLKTGSEVRLAGVTVGNVTDVTIDPEGNIVVTFQVLKRYSDRIRRDSKASIGFMGLLGEKSLDVTTGSLKEPILPPEGIVASIEPLDITQILARAAPSLEDIQKILSNLQELTAGITGSKGTLTQTMADVQEIVHKINQGKGTLGQLVDNPALYKETTLTVGAARRLIANLDQELAGWMKNPKFKGQAERALVNFGDTFANTREITADLREAAKRLPDVLKNLDLFLTNLNKAGANLPGLVTDAGALLGNMDKTTKAIQKSWLFRRNVPTPQEHTIRLDAGPAKE